MAVVTYPLGTPFAARSRGGDCRAHDTAQARHIHGPHRFAATTDCRISNGMLRVTVGAAGETPVLWVDAWRPPQGDDPPAWWPMGKVVIDATSVTALLTGVRLIRINPEAVTIRLVAPAIADVFVTLRRGERQVRIQHGSSRSPSIATKRRVAWASPVPAGVAYDNRAEETSAYIPGLFRFVTALVAMTSTSASVTSDTQTTAQFGAGVGTATATDRPVDYHAQLGDVSRPRLVVA